MAASVPREKGKQEDDDSEEEEEEEERRRVRFSGTPEEILERRKKRPPERRKVPPSISKPDPWKAQLIAWQPIIGGVYINTPLTSTLKYEDLVEYRRTIKVLAKRVPIEAYDLWRTRYINDLDSAFGGKDLKHWSLWKKELVKARNHLQRCRNSLKTFYLQYDKESFSSVDIPFNDIIRMLDTSEVTREQARQAHLDSDEFDKRLRFVYDAYIERNVMPGIQIDQEGLRESFNQQQRAERGDSRSSGASRSLFPDDDDDDLEYRSDEGDKPFLLDDDDDKPFIFGSDDDFEEEEDDDDDDDDDDKPLFADSDEDFKLPLKMARLGLRIPESVDFVGVPFVM